jgi:hypothetical protein
MSDLPSWVPPELEKEYREWEASLDAYIERWGKAVRQFLAEKGEHPAPEKVEKSD